MNIIERALDKLEKSESPGKLTATLPTTHATVREIDVDSLDLLSGQILDTTDQLAVTRPTVSKSSRHVEIDLKALRRAGYLTPEMHDTVRAEQYRRIKRPLLVNAFQDRPPRNANIVLVTSAVEGEGKSYTSLNLAMSIASEVDRRVLLIDGDVFKQGLTGRLRLGKEPGLTDFLKTEGADLADYLLKTNIPNLVCLPSGREEHQLTELWASERMCALVDELAKRYPDRLVLFDSPPMLQQTSTAVLASLVGQVVLVVEAEKTPQHVVCEALDMLGGDARVGFVLNKSNQRFSSEYGYGNYSQKQS